ncbi:hypothetical protein F4680DRAFT_470620 [Xylaria scruposa]|nr:hypothetical protein F4680DRAFT_470620 [Xylaria scruposa]
MATQPLSPWAQRYGMLYEIDSTLGEDGVRHSGYHTGHPRLDPKFFAEPISKSEIDNCGKFRHPNDIHRFFHIEEKQYETFRGFRPWQGSALMQYVRFSDRGLLPGGHWRPEVKPYKQAKREDLADISRLLDDDMIPVDEKSWFPFLRRDRWYDLYGTQRVTSGEKWSIDQPKLWKKLRVSLELVNRMLKALINDKHPALHTMLFGVLMRWRDTLAMRPFPAPFPNAMVLLSYDFYKRYCDDNNLDCPVDHLAHIPTEDWEFALSDFLKDLVWGFSDEPAGTLGTHLPAYGSLITLGILHEMMHAITSVRMKGYFPGDPEDAGDLEDLEDAGDPETPEDPDMVYEPFVDFDGIAEMGYAMEQRMFGGIVWSLHKDVEYPFGFHHRSWPTLSQVDGISTWGYKIGNHPIFSTVQKVVIHLLPALYTSKLLSKSFWEDKNIPRKSDNFFHFSQLLVGQTEFRPGAPFHWQEVTFYRGKLARGEVDPGETDMIESWQHWRSIWTESRSTWALPAYQIWSNSPWLYVSAWETLYEFGREFNRGNEIRCGQISISFTGTVSWSDGADLYRKALIPGSAKSAEWIVHCIGLLMMAAIPIRRSPLKQEELATDTILQLKPSARAPTLQPITVIPEYRFRTKRCDASELFDPINAGNQPIPVFDHIHILNVLRSALEVIIDAKVQVSKPWVLEIMDPDFHHGLWAPDWDFKIPDYAPDQLASWDAAQKRWV